MMISGYVLRGSCYQDDSRAVYFCGCPVNENGEFPGADRGLVFQGLVLRDASAHEGRAQHADASPDRRSLDGSREPAHNRPQHNHMTDPRNEE